MTLLSSRALLLIKDDFIIDIIAGPAWTLQPCSPSLVGKFWIESYAYLYAPGREFYANGRF